MGQPTIKVTLQGEPQAVERLAERMKKMFRVSYVSKNARISTRKKHAGRVGHVRRVLRVQPPQTERADGWKLVALLPVCALFVYVFRP